MVYNGRGFWDLNGTFTMKNLFDFFTTYICLVSFSALAVPWVATPFNPAAFPLAVRSPYLSAWLPQGSGQLAFKVAHFVSSLNN